MDETFVVEVNILLPSTFRRQHKKVDGDKKWTLTSTPAWTEELHSSHLQGDCERRSSKRSLCGRVMIDKRRDGRL